MFDDPIPAQPVRPNSALPAANSARMINLGAFVFIIRGTRLVEIAWPDDQKRTKPVYGTLVPQVKALIQELTGCEA